MGFAISASLIDLSFFAIRTVGAIKCAVVQLSNFSMYISLTNVFISVATRSCI